MQSPVRVSLHHSLALVLLVALGITVAGCPEARPPVDQTQALPIAKAMFEGEWYFQRTVIDTPWASEFTFIGDQGELDRVRWRIEEGFLVAVRSYQRFEGSDPDRNSSGDYEGEPVAAWPIVSHFDIRREYNSTTGEETNVIVENTSDRQWFERDYIRVDWSQNVITNWNFWAPNFVELEALAYAVSDPSDARAPVVEDNYLDVTSAFFAKPLTAIDPDYPEDGEIPMCWYFYHFDDCTAAEVVVRNSFLRVEDRRFEAQPWDGVDMELFGYFDVQRPTYDEQYGPTNTGRLRYQSKWNIWDRSHDGRSCSIDAECEDVVGSHCDELAGQCTLPYRDRDTRRIVWHTSPDLDPRFAEVVDEVVDQWNEPMRDTVNTLRVYECIDAGGDEGYCQSEIDDDIEIFAFCPNNPVQEGDPSYCGGAGLSPRLGDLRYNFLYNVPHAGRGNPFGFGPAQLDPLTGEIISAAALVYEAEIRSYGAWARDLVQLINGEIAEEDFIDGENVSDWIAARNSLPTQPVKYSEEEAERLASKVKLHYRHTLPSLSNGDSSPGARVEARRAAREILRDHPAVSADHGGAEARLDALIGSPLEQLALTDEDLLAAAMIPGSATTDAVLDAASPMRQVRQQRFRKARRARLQRNARRCAYFRDFVDPSVEGEAHRYAGMDPEEIRWEIMLGVYRGTMAHEMGHTIGLRHNLEGSADPFNYDPMYWLLRDDGDMRPRYLDPETSIEVEAGIRQYQYSSVMDYLSRFNSDHLGAQSYDKAAVKFGYGRVVEVMPDVGFNADLLNDEYVAHLLGWLQPLALYEEVEDDEEGDDDDDDDDSAGDDDDDDSAGDDEDTDGPLWGVHYTDYPAWYGDLQARRDVPQRLLSDYYGIAAWYYWPDTPLHTQLATDEGAPVVPYRFCSDEFVGSAPKCMYFDEGADLYEIPTDLAQRYERYYILNNFARDQMYFNADGHAWRIWDRYFDPMVSLNQLWVLDAQDLYATEPESADIDGYLQRYDGYGPFTMGVRESFNVFARTLARPEPGDYALVTDAVSGQEWVPMWGGEGMTISVNDGRYRSTDWDEDEGYFWDEAVTQIGFFSNKVLAMEALFDPTTYFLGQDTAADLRGFRVNYGANFFEPLMDLVGDLIVGDTAGFAPYEVDGQVVFSDYADYPATAPGGGVPIDPNAGFTIQLHAMLLGLALLPDTFDSDFIDSTRLWLDGDNAPVTDRPIISHSDPDSGLTWAAISYEDDEGVEEGIASRMLIRANAYATHLESGTLTEDEAVRVEQQLGLQRENLNLMRAIHMELGVLSY